MEQRLNFDAWFSELLTYAKDRGVPSLIDSSNKSSYLDYYDDGDSPEDCFDMEYEAKDVEEDE